MDVQAGRFSYAVEVFGNAGRIKMVLGNFLAVEPRSFTLIHNFMIVWIPGRDRRR